ncbi:MAG: hypothetical protein D3926_06710 [Desulfobacteraceae bacterium]|nr:MAG: hypothetical protein D3926_06710 [Desulfobacteraceae bacterium]
MDEEIKTLELAKLYEKQGYLEDALKVYQALALEDESNPDIDMAIERIKDQMSPAVTTVEKTAPEYGESMDGYPELTASEQVDLEGSVEDAGDREPIHRIAQLCEKWVRLIVLKHRFDNFKYIKTRLN